MSYEWTLRLRVERVTVTATDQHAAWNTLRKRPVEDFGIIVGAVPDGDEERAVWVHTSALMTLWGRKRDAWRFRRHAVGLGLPDTTESDRRYALDHGGLA